MRLDKYIWCVRLAKTRSLASDLCSSEKVKVNDAICKASKELKINDVIALKHAPIWRAFKVISLPKTRVGAPLVSSLCIEITPEEDLEQLRLLEEINRVNKSMGIVGRPTKKDRRDLDKFR
jgi:ribosome-associated heat shock protein Hsp15